MGQQQKEHKRFALKKMLTGITEFDEMTRGGLPRNRTTLVIGGPGSGKTIFALQTLVNGAREMGEPGIFVTFEESSKRIKENAAIFDWDLEALERKQLFFVDAHISPTTVQAGQFDLNGLLAGLQAKAQETGAKRIVFDGIDVLLNLLNDTQAERLEIFRLNEWMTQSGLTGIITGKFEGDNADSFQYYGFMQFMVDCVVILRQRLVNSIRLRDIHILKYRGSGYAANEYPLFITDNGLSVAEPSELEVDYPVSTERVSTGVERMDTMLGGGYYRGSSILISGSPGTSKTTLAGAFIEASCKRGERCIFVTLDESASEVTRNLASVGIDFAKHIKSGLLKVYSYASEAKSSEEHMIQLEALIREHKPRGMVIDPLSALIQPSGPERAYGVAKHLLRFCKARGVTLLCTSLLDGNDSRLESTEIQISTIADTWIHVSYIAQAGERNRALTIVKSRGTQHSNQVRELVLSENGLSLADVYSSGGEVLMGTMRWEKETADEAGEVLRQAAATRKRRGLELAQDEILARIQVLQSELESQRADLTLLNSEQQAREITKAHERKDILKLRNADAHPAVAPPATRKKGKHRE